MMQGKSQYFKSYWCRKTKNAR